MGKCLRIASILALSAGVAAQSAAAELPEKTRVHRARDIVVHERTLRPAEIFEDTPVETEILTAEEIERLPAANAADVAAKLPGIRIQSRLQGETAAVSIEGMPPAYTKILVNDQRYTGEIGAVDDLRDIPLENIERIEILRGAQGLRYGSEAGGGVINIVGREAPADGWRVSIHGGAGSDGNRRGSGTFAAGRGPLRGSLSFDHDQIDGFEAPDDVERAVFLPSGKDSRRLSRDVYGTLGYVPGPTLKLRTRFGWRRKDVDLVFSDAGTDLTLSEDAQRWLASQEIEWLATESTRITGALTWYRRITNSRIARTFELDEDELKLDLALERFFETGPLSHAVTLGLDVRQPRLRLQEGPLPDTIDNEALIPGNLDEKFRSAGVFLIGETELRDWFSVEWGARAQLHSRFESKILPHLALLFTPWRRDDGRALKIRLSWGRNFRAPSLRELFQPSVAQLGGAYFLAGNPELTTESSTSYRASLEFNPVSWLSLSAGGFMNDIEDHIRATFAGSVQIGTERIEAPPPPTKPGLELICKVTNNFFPDCAALEDVETFFIDVPITSQVFRKNNLDTVKTRGIEARLQLRPHELFDLQLGYTLLDTQVVDSNVNLRELPNEPRHVIDGRVRLELPGFGTQLTVRARWRDRALTETSGTGLLSFGTTSLSDPSVTVDARITQPIAEHFELYADVFNLTDNRVVDSLVVRGRTVFIGFRARFD